MRTVFPLCLIAFLLLIATLSAAENTNHPPIVLQKDGKPLARYRYEDVPFKPYIDELRTPSGKNILRDAPWDHLHHHGLMFALHAADCSFWGELDENGKQITVEKKHTDNFIESTLIWNTPDSTTVLRETRKISVNQENGITLLDWQSTLQVPEATNETTVLGGSGYYYGLGMRFVEEMDNGGRFFNDTGKHDGEIVRGDERLKRCRWMAYTVKLDGQPVTVAVFDHPSNPASMTAFTMGEASDAFAYISATMNMHREPVRLRTGQAFAVQYRVALWDGEVSPEIVEKAYADYAKCGGDSPCQ